jgi:acyl-ACP thioesterase
MKRKPRKPTIKEVGQFSVDTYNYVRQLEQRIGEVMSTLSLYLEMNKDIDKLNKYAEKRMKELQNNEEKSTQHTKRKKKPTKRSRTPKASSKDS